MKEPSNEEQDLYKYFNPKELKEQLNAVIPKTLMRPEVYEKKIEKPKSIIKIDTSYPFEGMF